MSKDIKKEIATFATTIVPPCSILDVGCGTRPYEELFSGCTYVGIDAEESGRESAGKVADVFFDGLHIPLEDNLFDIVLCTQVLEHCIDPAVLLHEIHRTLKPGGRLFLTVPFMWGEHETPFDFRRYSSFGIQKALTETGFRIDRFDRITPSIKAIETLVNAEVQNNKRSVTYTPSLSRSVAEKILSFTWRGTLYLWRKLYTFERIYLDNLIIATKI